MTDDTKTNEKMMPLEEVTAPSGVKIKILKHLTVGVHEGPNAYPNSPPLVFVDPSERPNSCVEVFVLAARLEKLDPVRHRAVYEVLEDVEAIFGKDAAWKWGPELLQKALQRSYAERVNLPLDDVSDEQPPRWCLVFDVHSQGHCIVCCRPTATWISAPIDEHTLKCELQLQSAWCCEGCFANMSDTVTEAIRAAGNPTGLARRPHCGRG